MHQRTRTPDPLYSLTLVPLEMLTLVYYVFTAGTPPQPTNWLDSRRRMELVWGETPQGGLQKRPFTGGSDTLVLFLGLLVPVTRTCFLHLSDPYEAPDRYRGCRENKEEKTKLKMYWAFMKLQELKIKITFFLGTIGHLGEGHMAS